MAKRRKGETGGILGLVFSLGLTLSFPAFSQGPAASQVLATAQTPLTAKELGDCNWIVSYRGRTYDLAPLTREALARPIETDLRYALQRVPESNNHLNQMSSHLKAARAHTILASIFISGFLMARILHSGEKNPSRQDEYNIISAATGAFFLGATYSSWKATTEAKQELVNAVSAFNEASPHKILPSPPGRREPDLPAPLSP